MTLACSHGSPARFASAHAYVDVLPEQLGYRLSAMLWLTLAPKDIHRVGERIAAHDQIAFTGAISGSNNLMAIAICQDTDDLYRNLSEQLGQIEEIFSYEASIRTASLKQHGSGSPSFVDSWTVATICGDRWAPAGGPFRVVVNCVVTEPSWSTAVFVDRIDTSALASERAMSSANPI